MTTLVIGHPSTARPATPRATRVGPGLFTRLVDAFVASRMARVEHEVNERLGKTLAELRADADRRYRAM